MGKPFREKNGFELRINWNIVISLKGYWIPSYGHFEW